MLAYTLRRTLWAIPTILAVITACYLLLHLTPGGPFDTEKQLSAAVLANEVGCRLSRAENERQ